jgi:hypothetical protein
LCCVQDLTLTPFYLIKKWSGSGGRACEALSLNPNATKTEKKKKKEKLECQTNQDCTTEPEATLPLQL